MAQLYPTPAISSPTTFTLTVTNAAGDTATQTATVGVQAVSVTSITGPAYVSAGHTATYTAAVSGSVNTAVTWGTSAGSIDSTGTLTAPTGSPYSTTPTTITLTATSVNGGTPATLNVTVVPLPSITSFTLNPATVNYGSAGTMTPVFTLGAGQIAGLGSVTSGQAVSTGNLTADKTFTLTVTNLAGDTATQNLTAPVATVSVSAPTPTGQTITTGDTLAFTSSVSGSSNTNVTWSANGGTFGGNSPAYDPLGNPQTVVALSPNTWTAPAAGTYSITANSVAPTGYSASTPITVVGPPVITSFSAAMPSITTGNSTNLTPVFSNGTAVITPGNITPTSGTAFSTGTLTATTTYKLTVTNAAGLSLSRWVTVNVVKGATSTVSGTMAAGRSGHTVTLLADGSVLLAGGNGSTTAERYSVTGALGTISAPMANVRYRHTATLLANGKVLLAGGSDGTAAQSSAEIFDPVAGTFTVSSSSMTSARQNHTAALLPDGRVLLSGGIDASSTALSSTDIYDPVADTFTAGPALASAAEFLTSTSLDNGKSPRRRRRRHHQRHGLGPVPGERRLQHPLARACPYATHRHAPPLAATGSSSPVALPLAAPSAPARSSTARVSRIQPPSPRRATATPPTFSRAARCCCWAAPPTARTPLPRPPCTIPARRRSSPRADSPPRALSLRPPSCATAWS